MGDFSINIKSSDTDKDVLEVFVILEVYKILCRNKRTFMKNSKSLIPPFFLLFLKTNKPKNSGKKTPTIETALSDHHKMITGFI